MHTAETDLPGRISAGSSAPPTMVTRKRPRPSAQEQDTQLPCQDDDAAATAAADATGPEAEAAQISPRPLRRAKRQATEGKSQEQIQQAFCDLDLIQQVALPEVMKLADENSIVWCRVKGFPAWPVSSVAVWHMSVNDEVSTSATPCHRRTVAAACQMQIKILDCMIICPCACLHKGLIQPLVSLLNSTLFTIC